MKTFKCTWGNKSGLVKLKDFTEEKGYTSEEIHMVSMLARGDSITLTDGINTPVEVTRVDQAIYTIEDLHQSVNDIYAMFDDGKITRESANEILRNCCESFIESN